MKGDCILDPFAGSGTTLVEANTHSMDSIGVDIKELIQVAAVVVSMVEFLDRKAKQTTESTTP